MPLTLEKLRAPLNDEDREDLLKIYADAPSWLRRDHDEQHFLQFVLNESEIVLAVRFNDRLLGAVGVAREEEGKYRLLGLSVRKTTRRRGVGHFMFEQLDQLYTGQQLIIGTRQQATTDALLSKAGFSKLEGKDEDDRVTWIKEIR